MSALAFVATLLLALSAPSSAALIRAPSAPANTTATARALVSHASGSGAVMHLKQRQFMEVKLGPFDDAGAACDYCFTSFTKEGVPPAGPIAPACVCMAYPDAGKYNMFCATPASAAGFVADKNGCRCKALNMEAMGSTTCEPIS